MDPKEVLHFHNEIGAGRIKVGAKDFMCIGALPPFDHPHVFVNMGETNEAICPYCATKFVFDPNLDGGCDPPECAYTWERETAFEGPEPRPAPYEARPAPPAPKAPAPPVAYAGCSFLATFTSEEALAAAVRGLAAEGFEVQTFAPAPSERSELGSFLPKVILVGGACGVALGFGMESYANIVGYPLDIGGRPEFSWPSFVPIAFEIGALLAVLSGFFGYLVAASLPRLYDPVDEQRSMRRAMSDAWVIAVRARDRRGCDRARDIVKALEPIDIEEMSS